ncbi:alkaline shock response membrane anchor protein AmaP [Paenibacillus alkalitolerans]|uniref:alkaline shock response membrane anchor protein AmaP n=1 Tax=Paenibacillus alkalitolerans TaxID=2799335 RepID=UPI0018F5AA00|nr:alkaline shock response membrane anchor protein AmaP [Paenibacillus alkalitolerans]
MARVFDKFLLFIYSLIVLIATILGIAIVIEWIPQEELDTLYANPGVNYAALVAIVVLFLLSLRFLYISLRRSRERTGSIDQRTDFGDVRISLETVENLSLKAASRIRGVKDLRSRVRVTDSGLEIQIRTVIDGESSIPQLTEEMQRGVKEHIEEVTGIPVSSVTVYVANVVQTQTFKARVE